MIAKKISIKQVLIGYPPVIWMLLGTVVIFSITGENFFSYNNIINILKQASPFLILALAQTLAILSGGIDLSVGYVMSFCGVVVAMLLKNDVPLVVAIFAGLFSGMLCGSINGLLVSKFKLPYFIATYGLGNIIYGLGSLLTKGVSQPALDRTFRFISDGSILGFPMVILIALIVFLSLNFFIVRTSLGRNIYGLGGNREALFLSGVNVKKAEILVFTVVGLLVGIAGIIFAARSASGHPGYGAGWEFEAVAATIIGGNSFSEGKGSAKKTLLGVFFIQILKTGLNISGVAPQAQSFLIGLIVVLAISIDVLAQRKK